MPANDCTYSNNSWVYLQDDDGNVFSAPVSEFTIELDTNSYTGDFCAHGEAVFDALFGYSKRSEFKSRAPKKVIFNGNVTVCIWKDGTKTIARCHDGDEFDRNTGVIICAIKRWMPGGSYWLDAMSEVVKLGSKVDDRVSDKQKRACVDERPDVIDDEPTDDARKTKPTDWYHRGLAYDDDFKLECVNRVESGESMAEVARTSGIATSTIYRWCDEFGVKATRPYVRRADRA